MKRGREVRHARVVLGALIAGAVLAGNGALVYLGGTYAYYSDTTTAPLVEITVSPGTTTTTTTATTTTSKARQTQQAPAAPEAGKPARPPGHDHAATRAQPKAVAPPTQAEQAGPHRKLTGYGPDSDAGLPGLVLPTPIRSRESRFSTGEASDERGGSGTTASGAALPGGW